jgi:microcystin-dependent protein
MNTESFFAEIGIAGFNFAPVGWALCNGQLIPISQNTALFSLLGTTYGGDGRTTFALPNLQGAAALHSGQGPGLSDYPLGQKGGQETVTLSDLQMPVHSHAGQAGGQDALTQAATNQTGTSNNPEDRVPANNGELRYAATANAAMAALELTTQPAGGAQPFSTLQPYLVLNYCIALQGVFPPRS